jgi:hypothetical protein
VTAERRLAKVEAALGPQELVLRWLAEAHAYDDFVAYSRALYALGPEAMPLDRLVRQTRENAEAPRRGGSRSGGDEGIRRVLGQTLVLYHLILRTIVVTQETLDRELLLHAVFSAYLGLVAIDAEDDRARAGQGRNERLAILRSAVRARVADLRAHAAARARVEAKHFDGQPILFEATARAWSEQVELMEQLADLADRLAELDGLDPAAADDPDAFDTRVEQLVADLVEPAQVKALDEMGEGRRAMTIAMRWLAPKLG